jgi:hypothetical protein
MTDRIVAKWPVQVDDRTHKIGGGDVVHVACQDPTRVNVVTVWTIEPRDAGFSTKRTVQVFGTGQPLPFFAKPLGSGIAGGGRLVWHVFELPGPESLPLGDEALIEVTG